MTLRHSDLHHDGRDPSIGKHRENGRGCQGNNLANCSALLGREAIAKQRTGASDNETGGGGGGFFGSLQVAPITTNSRLKPLFALTIADTTSCETGCALSQYPDEVSLHLDAFGKRPLAVLSPGLLPSRTPSLPATA